MKRFLKEGNEELIIIFSGWATDYHLYEEMMSETEKSVLVFYDYNDLGNEDFSFLSDYKDITVLAWSLGVWVANKYLPDHENLKSRIAINGTLFPIDNMRGIPDLIFQGTIDNLTERTLDKFRKRMCRDEYSYFMLHKPERDFDNLKNELIALQNMIVEDEDILSKAAVLLEEDIPSVVYPKNKKWDIAVIGESDMIFLAENQKRGWDGFAAKTEILPLAHYSASYFINYMK